MSDERFKSDESISRKDQILNLIEIVCRKFKETPRRAYIEGAAEVIAKHLTVAEAMSFLDPLPSKYDSFPGMVTIEFEIKNFQTRRKPQSNFKEKREWVSKQAPGTPPASEALFEMILDEKSHTSAFTMARNIGRHASMTDAELWECFDSWVKGEVNPKLIDREKTEDEMYKDLFG